MAYKKWEPHPDRPVLTDVLVQGDKTYKGTPNPDRTSRVEFIYTNPEGQIICSAFRKDGRTVCTSTMLMPNGRCKKHGGNTPSGVASHAFKTGKSSKYLPTRLLERYEEALGDETLMDMTEDLAVIDARLSDLYIQLDEGGGGEIFKIAQEAFASFNAASQDGDTQAMRENLRRLGTALNDGAKDSYLWTEIRQLQEQRRKIILSTAKHLQLTNQTITVTKVNLLISALLDSVRRNVADKQLLGRISADFMRITGSMRSNKQLTS
jgi:hypothetical protein